MIYTTTISKKSHCPLWNIEINILGKYKLNDNDDIPYQATYMYSLCPIVENNKLPYDRQNKDLTQFSFCNIDHCPCLKNFKEKIDIRKDGYSQ